MLEGHKYAGVTLDYYDDHGETLKSMFPTLDDLPEMIKSADIRPKEKLPNEAFALIMLDRGHAFRKFACVDPGTTAMSTIYFMEHGGKLPEEAQKTAATNLVGACLEHGIMPPAEMTKASMSGNWGMKKKAADDDEAEDKGRPPTPEQKAKIQDFLRSNSNLSDDEFHAFVEDMGVNPHFAEPIAYEMAHKSKSASKDIISGGKADSKPAGDFSPSQMAMRKKVEMEHSNSPALAKEISRDHLEEFPDYYSRLKKMEDEAKKEKKANVVDVTGQSPKTRVVMSRPVDENDYAVKTADGTLRYPIDTWDRVKTAEAYFQENKIRMEPEVRRQYAVKLARKSFISGYPLAADITELGALGYNNDEHLRDAIEMRKTACDPVSGEREFLTDLFEKRSEISPEVYAECLRRFDIMSGLDHGWDKVVLDPWASTFGVKTASVVWEQGAERVTEEELVNLARNGSKMVKKQFSTEFADQFQKDPVAMFESMPDPQKKLLSRMAGDVAHSGESEFMPTRASEQAGGGHKASLE